MGWPASERASFRVKSDARGRARSARECTVSPRQSASSHSSSPRSCGASCSDEFGTCTTSRGTPWSRESWVSRSCCSWYGARSTGPREASSSASPRAFCRCGSWCSRFAFGAARALRSNRAATASLSPAPVGDQLRPRERPRQVLRVLEPALVVLAVFPHRQPFLGDGRKRRREARIGACAVYDLAADDGKERLDVLDPILRHLEVVGGKDREVGELPGLQRALPALLAR